MKVPKSLLPTLEAGFFEAIRASHQIWARSQLAYFWWLAPFPPISAFPWLAMRLKRPQAALGCSRRVPQKSVCANIDAIHLSVRGWSPQSPGFLRGDFPARTAARPRHVVGDQEHWHARRGRDQLACRRRARYARLFQFELKAPFARHLPDWPTTSGPGPPVAAPHHPAAPRRLVRAGRRRGPPRVSPRGPPAPAWSRPTRALPPQQRAGRRSRPGSARTPQRHCRLAYGVALHVM